MADVVQKWKFVTAKDVARTVEFLQKCMNYFAPRPDFPLYHYTSGENFIRIIYETGDLWATQVSCLNDTTELQYSVDELLKRIALRLPSQDVRVNNLRASISSLLSAPITEAAGIFVACFSERSDDLSQWRAYSGGEGGYCIEFESAKLRELGENTFLVKVDYNPASHAAFLDDLLNAAEDLYLTLEGRAAAANEEEWQQEFIRFFFDHAQFFSPCLKHPKFADEREWRLVRFLNDKDHGNLRFRQRTSMLSRHIPLGFEGAIPVSGVVIGPCRYPQITKFAVGDMLEIKGHKAALDNIRFSEVPYRTV